MTFEPNKYITQIKGKDYLEVKWRIVWVRSEHPDWSIQTEITERVEGGAIVKATIVDDTGRTLATAHKMETKQGFPDYLEKAETGAIGRALALCGYGTQFTADELEEGQRIVDAPVQKAGSAKPQVNLWCDYHKCAMRPNINGNPYHKDEQRGFCNGYGFPDEKEEWKQKTKGER